MSNQTNKKSPPNRPRQTELSHRETEVLYLLAQDYLDKEIAAELGISFNTVRTHLHHIFQKLRVRTRTGAVVRFLMKEEAWGRVKYRRKCSHPYP